MSPTLHQFINQLEKDVPCYSHVRRVSKRICLKKCNSMVPGNMGQFAAVRNRSTKGDFLISVKNSLVDDWCRSQGTVVQNLFGYNPGLNILVKHDSSPRSADYQIVVEVLQRAKRHHSLPPY